MVKRKLQRVPEIGSRGGSTRVQSLLYIPGQLISLVKDCVLGLKWHESRSFHIISGISTA
jgi:hypothetical protein